MTTKNITTVYLVLEVNWDGQEVRAVFADREAAETYIDHHPVGHWMDTEEWRVN